MIKDSISCEEAFKIIEEESKTHFNPKLVTVFLKHKEKYAKIDLKFREITNIPEQNK